MDCHSYYCNSMHTIATLNLKNWREKHRGFQWASAFLNVAHLYDTNADLPDIGATFFACSVLSSFGYLVQSTTLAPASTDAPSAYARNFIVRWRKARFSHAGRGGLEWPWRAVGAHAGTCLVLIDRKKEKSLLLSSFTHCNFIFVSLFCLDEEVWKCGLMAVCNISLSYESIFNKGMLR